MVVEKNKPPVKKIVPLFWHYSKNSQNSIELSHLALRNSKTITWFQVERFSLLTKAFTSSKVNVTKFRTKWPYIAQKKFTILCRESAKVWMLQNQQKLFKTANWHHIWNIIHKEALCWHQTSFSSIWITTSITCFEIQGQFLWSTWRNNTEKGNFPFLFVIITKVYKIVK